MTPGTATGRGTGGKRLYTWKLTFSRGEGAQDQGGDIPTISHPTEIIIIGTDPTQPGTMAGTGRLEESRGKQAE